MNSTILNIYLQFYGNCSTKAMKHVVQWTKNNSKAEYDFMNNAFKTFVVDQKSILQVKRQTTRSTVNERYQILYYHRLDITAVIVVDIFDLHHFSLRFNCFKCPAKGIFLKKKTIADADNPAAKTFGNNSGTQQAY